MGKYTSLWVKKKKEHFKRRNVQLESLFMAEFITNKLQEQLSIKINIRIRRKDKSVAKYACINVTFHYFKLTYLY